MPRTYLMGAPKITDEELVGLGVEIVRTGVSGNREIKVPENTLENYKDLIREKMDAGFWNEIIGEREIVFIFKFTDGTIKEFTLSEENEAEVAKLCSEFNDDPPKKTRNVYKYISNNDFYHDFVMKHYGELVTRAL